jgi:hypothetical protein
MGVTAYPDQRRGRDKAAVDACLDGLPFGRGDSADWKAAGLALTFRHDG